MKHASLLRQRRFVHGLAQSALASLAEDPWVGDSATADHDAVDTCFVESRNGLVGSSDIAAAHDRYRDCALDLADHVPVGEPAVALNPGAPVNCNHCAPRVFDYLCDLDRIDRALVPTDSDLHCDRDRDGPADAAKDLLKLRQVAKQR